MSDYQHEFLQFSIENQILSFGDFTLKSGRASPYFFNSGLFNSGVKLSLLGQFYSKAIIASGTGFDMLFGPAYKGIPLVSTVAIAMAERHERDLAYAFNRKETKEHGEGGTIVGAPLQGRVLIIDDVISAGTSIRESAAIIQESGAQPAGVAISLDRQELGNGNISAIQEIEQDLGIPVISIANLDTLLDYLITHPELKQWQKKISTYREHYGT